MKTVNDIFNMEDCVVKDERGVVLALLSDEDGVISVNKTTACSIGLYFYILWYLGELGFEVK